MSLEDEPDYEVKEDCIGFEWYEPGMFYDYDDFDEEDTLSAG